MKFTRKKFFDGFRDKIDPSIEQGQVDGFEFLLGQIENDSAWKSIPEISYALSTVYHETAGSMQPVEEGYYLGSKARVKAFQKTLRYYPYFGRGYVQLTWETKKIPNYSKASNALGVDFVKHPDLVMVPENAYKILTLGMHQGWFTGKKLSDYISDTGKDYKSARKIINGTDKASLIAGYAVQFEQILRDSKSTSAAASKTATSELTDSTTTSGGTPAETPPPTPAPIIQTPTIAVEAVVAAPTEEASKEDTLTKIGNKVAAAWAAAGAAVIGIGTWLSSTPQGIATAIVIAVAVIGGVYMLVNALRQNAKDKRDAANKLREDELKLEREKMAHETQLYILKSAADPQLNAVKIVPPAQELANSDTEAQ